MGKRLPFFPTSIWDGSGENRPAPVELIDSSPDFDDWDQMTAEVISLEVQVGGLLVSTNLEEWQDFSSLSNNWTNKTGYTASYKKWGSLIKVRGAVVPGTITDGTTITTLPVGFRPAHILSFPVVGSEVDAEDVNAKVVIGTDGTIKIYNLTSTTVSIDLSTIIFFDDE